MTIQQLYQKGKLQLQKAGIESPAFDALCFIKKDFELDRKGLILYGSTEADEKKAQSFMLRISQRCTHRPLQYILESWEFMDMNLKVGDGVLIPREDTYVLCKTAAEYILDDSPQKGVDLCAGTGAVALGICKLKKNVSITAVEWYDDALAYLQDNLTKYGKDKVKASKGNILLKDTPKDILNTTDKLDFLVSNPPYIKSEELPFLQEEVKKEPHSALDGGTDGLMFYRAISSIWFPWLKKGAFVAVEIGETQAEEVSELFAEHGLSQIKISKDFNGLNRVVSGIILQT